MRALTLGCAHTHVHLSIYKRGRAHTLTHVSNEPNHNNPIVIVCNGRRRFKLKWLMHRVCVCDCSQSAAHQYCNTAHAMIKLRANLMTIS